MLSTRFKLMWISLFVAVGASCSSRDKSLLFTTSPATSVAVGASYSYSGTVTRATGPVTFSLTTSPAGMMVSPSGVVTWTPTSYDVGSHPVVLRAVSGRRSGAQSWTVQVVAASPLVAVGGGTEDGATLRTNWRDSLEAAGAVPLQALVGVVTADDHGLPVAGWFSWVKPSGIPDLASHAEPSLNSWANEDSRADFLLMVETFALTVRPRWLVLGDRADWEKVGPEEWARWLEVIRQARHRVRSVSPETFVLAGSDPEAPFSLSLFAVEPR